MLKVQRLLMVAVWLGVAGAANAGAVKIFDFQPILNGETANPNVDGMAILNYNAAQDITHIRVTLTGLEPNTVYRADIRGRGGSNVQFETNAAGVGNVGTEAITDITTASDGSQVNVRVLVFIDENNDLQPDPSEARALGCVTGACEIPFLSCSVDADCDDGSPCSIDSCELNFCRFDLVECDDGDPCTSDFCDTSDGTCTFTPIFNCTP